MAKKPMSNEEICETGVIDEREKEEEEEEEEQDLDDWGDWRMNDEDEEGSENQEAIDILCLFCDSKYSSCHVLFEHCRSSHRFNFHGIRKSLALDFYGSVKFINYVRSQVMENKCWSCGFSCQSNQDLQNHLHETVNFVGNVLPWENDKYLRPFVKDDPLLYSFDEDEEEEIEDKYSMSADVDEPRKDVGSLEEICVDDKKDVKVLACDIGNSNENGRQEVASDSICYAKGAIPLEDMTINDANEHLGSCDRKPNDKIIEVSFSDVVAKGIKKVNENYFGSYSSFGIHREMISDKVRTDAYRQAILSNPSLLNGAVVMDVGCGTGILSLFAAQAGASRVIAIEASDKMATVATQIAKDNGLLCSDSPNKHSNHCTGVIQVVQGMVEELDKSMQIQPHSIDVLLSEWMGYCLLYESMLSSVLFARDQWLKPGGAILPDLATIFVAGFGRGSTSVPFWENVYGFNMSCIGREVLEDAAQAPIVDVVDSQDIVTDAVVLQTFDLGRMKIDEMDFTSSIELEPKLDNLIKETECSTTLCYGVVLWFETGFTSRFCKEMPTVLSTSPYTPRTHWSQTLLTFREPIALASGKYNADKLAAVGSDANPASKMHTRISIARASQHRSIDISLEIAGISHDGRKRNWPVQIFNLC
ncbi:probable protein arginine N-methyltransferase 3 [Malania oleifera]|uniref:probable protein arginine N-methyltransferase 3 n=1 Tax=Malania oleifera TaxID=397392 RepID=UPI0025AEA701|nr:probable protein arginine N-methyltransferase 3 [Malania oleifera]